MVNNTNSINIIKESQIPELTEEDMPMLFISKLNSIRR